MSNGEELSLLPCPFCGGEAKIYECYSSVLPVPGEAARYVASCVQINCVDSRPRGTRAEAAAFWNRRPSPSAVEAAEVVGWTLAENLKAVRNTGTAKHINLHDRSYGPTYIPLYASPPPASPSAPQGVEVPEGWVLVPREPTTDMIVAGRDIDYTAPEVYRAMLAAAPAIQTSPEGTL